MTDSEILEIMELMNSITYGFKDKDGKNILETNFKKWDEEFDQFYYLQTPEELIASKCGVCWDQVELERKLFLDKNVQIKTYFIYIATEDMLPSHTFLTYEKDKKYYWFEHSWGKYRGIHEYDSEMELLLDIKEKFMNEYNDNGGNVYIYEYQKPKNHITCEEFYTYIEKQNLVKTNKPFYFYHLINKDVDMTNGIISLQYMYDHQLFALFDKNALKYLDRITNDWNIDKYKGKNNLTREEYIDALNAFRGKWGANYIYFFKYAPYKNMGNKIKELSKYKDIYRININDEEIQKQIADIFYGFDMNNSDNQQLDREYYENVSKEKYFCQYDESIEMNFSRINHIGIRFKNGNCPLKFLEKVDWE